MSLTARCHHPFTKNGSFPSATLISTLRIVKEQAEQAANLNTLTKAKIPEVCNLFAQVK
jgi:hypothetical protein